MNSPLVLLLPLAVVLAPMIYFVLRDRRIANARLKNALDRGLSPDQVFDLFDSAVVVDRKQGVVAFIAIERAVRPREHGIDRDAYMARSDIKEPITNLGALEVHVGEKLVDLSIHTNEANSLNSERRFSFSTSKASMPAVRKLMAAWPGNAPARYVDTLLIGGD
ncbi:MAG: hypothetical protein U1E77_19240 [Inhella sp.]